MMLRTLLLSALAGLGASHWEISGLDDLGELPPLIESPVNLRPVDATLPSAVLGVGVALAVGGPFSAVLELTDQVSGNPLADDDFRLGTTFSGFGRAKDLVHSCTLSAGMRLELGG